MVNACRADIVTCGETIEDIGEDPYCGNALGWISLKPFLQTTFFTRFRIFNSVPDLILPMVVAVAISENEKWASIFGLVAGIIIDALSGSALVLLPLLYVLVGYIAGLLCIHFFRGFGKYL